MFVYVPEGAESILPTQTGETSTPGVAARPVFTTRSVRGGEALPVNSTASTCNTDQLISIECATEGATIYYTLDDIELDPYGAGALTFDPLHPIETCGDQSVCRIQAIALVPQMYPSEIACVAVSIDFLRASTPSISPIPGTHAADFTITMTSQDDGAELWYTFSTTGPVEDPVPGVSHRYTGGIPVSGNGTHAWIRVIASVEQLKDSTVAEAAYIIAYPQAAAPEFDPPAGSYSMDIAIELGSDTPDAEIWYNTSPGGTPPDPIPGLATLYLEGNPIDLTGHGSEITIAAVAVKGQLLDSTVSVAHYVIDYLRTSTPSFSPVSGVYSTDIAVALECATPDSVIWYTTATGGPPADPEPGTASVYAAPIPVAGHGTELWIKAVATAAGMQDSLVADTCYGIQYPPLPTPSIVGASGVSSQEMYVVWTPSVGAAAYELYRDGMLVTTVPTTDATDVGLTPATTYVYQVRAVRPDGPPSELSSAVSGTTWLPAPASVTATDSLFYNKVRIRWSAVPGAWDYEVRSSLDAMGPYGPVGTSGGSLELFDYSGGMRYYVVRAIAPITGEYSAYDPGSSGVPEAVYLTWAGGDPWDTWLVMDQALWGPWSERHYEDYLPGDPSELLDGSRTIYMEGYQQGAVLLRQFVLTYQTQIENWVANGGRLFINTSPDGWVGSYPVGFGGLWFDTALSSTSIHDVSGGHPIFYVPYPTMHDFYGMPLCSTARVSGPGMVLMAGDVGPVLLELPLGPGRVIFGTLGNPLMMDYPWEAMNLRSNILRYLFDLLPW